jgi:type II secretory pathway pseudopilin PulG
LKREENKPVSRGLKISIAVLVFLVAISLITLPSLQRAVERASRNTRTEEQARREVMQPVISTPTDVTLKAQLFFLSAGSSGSLEAVAGELPLSADPVEQLINALIANAPAPERRTLPADTTLLAFYLLPDGTAIADFSDALAAECPSGILSEQTVVDSVTRTLGANVSEVRQLKILVHGQEAETLAGHLDLSAAFPVPNAATATPSAPSASTPAATGKAPTNLKPPASATSTPASGAPANPLPN